jgi:UDP-N-acetylglucosamine:LPS N-acetylglucosamine transferase
VDVIGKTAKAEQLPTVCAPAPGVRELKIGLVASAGGHLSELRKVAQAWSGWPTFWVTTSNVVSDSLGQGSTVYVVGECNRQHPLRVIQVLFRCLCILAKERPAVIISTGAAAGCLICLLGRLWGARIVWLDSITNVKRVSLSGRLVRPFADLFLVQWPELAEKYRGAEYVGTVL